MSNYRKNTFVVDFSVLPVRPKLDKVREFLLNHVQIDMNKIKNIQPSITKAQIFIETETKELAERIVEEHNMQHSQEHEGNLIAIPLFIPDNAIEVRVMDLPPQMPNNIIAKHFTQYGEVLSVNNDTWKDYFTGLPNGTRLIRMRLRKAIPSYVPVDGELSYVSYRNQISTCRHCGHNMHIGRSCSEARKEILRPALDQQNPATYADVMDDDSYTVQSSDERDQQSISTSEENISQQEHEIVDQTRLSPPIAEVHYHNEPSLSRTRSGAVPKSRTKQANKTITAIRRSNRSHRAIRYLRW